MEDNFPRGGGSELTPLELKKIHHKAEEDAAAENQVTAESSSRTLVKRKRYDNQKFSKKKKSSTLIAPKVLLDSLRYKDVRVGMKFMGVVKEINDFDLVVSLPNHLSAFLAITDISDLIAKKIEALTADDEDDEEEEKEEAQLADLVKLEELFKVGQVIQVAVKNIESEKKKIELTMNPSYLNKGLDYASLNEGFILTGVVESEEDKGYIVSLGTADSKKGFISFKEAQDKKLMQGCAYMFKVLSNSRVIALSLWNNESEPVILDALQCNSMMPGNYLKGLVTSIQTRGIILNSNGFSVHLDYFHIPADRLRKPDFGYELGDELSACLVYADWEEKKFGISSLLSTLSMFTEELELGSLVEATVIFIDPLNGLFMDLNGSTGFVHISKIDDAKVEKIEKTFKIGSNQKCRIIEFDPINGHYMLSMQPSILNAPFFTYDSVQVGALLKGEIIKIEKYGVLISLSSFVKALCPIQQLTEIPIASAHSKFQVGQRVRFRVLKVNSKEKKIVVTMKKSLLKSELPILAAYHDAKPKMLTHGIVDCIKEFGCFIQFYNGVRGFLPLEEINASEIKHHPSEYLFVGQVVECRVISCKPEESKLKVSLLPAGKKNVPTLPPAAKEEIKSVKVGDVVNGFVINITKHGCFVKLQGGKLVARVKISEISKDYVKKWQKLVNVGQKVRGIVTAVEDEGKKIEMSFKKLQIMESTDESEDDEAVEKVDSEEEQIEEEEQKEGIDLSASFEDEQAEQDKSFVEEEVVDEEIVLKKKSKKEREIEQEQLLLKQPKETPECQEDFEKLLLGSPNNSYLWVRYMAYQIKLGDIQKARQVAEKALSTISHRMERDKFNIWVALLNLENSFGTEKTLNAVFEKAVCYSSNPKHPYLQLAKIFEKSGKLEEAHALYQKACKKFRSCKVWISYAYFCFINGDEARGRKLFNESILSLPKRKHIKITMKFAQLEFNKGDPERGRTIFESLMANNPARTDLWSVYADMEEKIGDVALVRRLYERIVSFKMSSKKIKFFFKRFLSYEKGRGDAEGMERVKALAQQYVQSLDR